MYILDQGGGCVFGLKINSSFSVEAFLLHIRAADEDLFSPPQAKIFLANGAEVVVSDG